MVTSGNPAQQHHLGYRVFITGIYKLTRKVLIAFIERVNKHIRIRMKHEHNNYKH